MAQLEQQINLPKTGLQRSIGVAKISFKNRDQKTVLDDLYQQGSAKLRFARTEPKRLTEAVLINTSGGMTGGDRFEVEVAWGSDTTAIVTTQTAERHYKSLGDVATINSRLTVADGACALWLPQESIMFDGAAYARSTYIDLAQNARLLAVETSLFGRKAMGEIVNTGQVTERWEIRRAGKLVFADAFGLQGDIDAKLNQAAIAGGAKAISTIIYVGDDLMQTRDEINELLGAGNKSNGVAKEVCGCGTCVDGILIIRLFATTGQDIREKIMILLNKLLVKLAKNSDTKSLLPRVWSL